MKRRFPFIKILLTLFSNCSIYAEEKSDDELMQQLGKGFSTIGGSFNESVKELLKNITIQNENNKQLMTTIYILLAIIAVVFVLIIAFMIVQSISNLKYQKMQQKQFESTLNLIKETQKIVQKQSLPLKSNLELPGTEYIETKELQTLAETCESLGSKIDAHTNRRNNSKNVSELVFKISKQVGIGHDVATIYFCSSMVYDAGFLSIPDDFFMTDILSSEERKIMKSHVEKAFEYISFVPNKYIPIFNDACSYHHENMNGTGYPKGLRAEDIPLVARIIHVAESYISLVSRRTYHKIRDKESAIAELRKKPGIYDSDIVDALETVV